MGSSELRALVRREIWAVAAWLAGVALLLSVRYVPGQDTANHAAVADLACRLLRGEPEVARFYELRLLDTSYRLYYALTIPLTCAVGARAAVHVAVLLMWTGFVGACRALVGALGRPPWVVLALAPWFFGLQLFLGFLPSLCGWVTACWALWALVRAADTGRRRYVVLAGAFGAATFFAHLVMSVLWAAAVTAWVLHDRRARWRQGLALSLVIVVPLVAWLPARLAATGSSTRGFLRSLQFMSPSKHLDWIPRATTGLFYDPWARAGRAALVLLALSALWWVWQRRRAPTGPLPPGLAVLAGTTALWLVAYLVVPFGGRDAWGINVRFIAPVLVLSTLLGAQLLGRARWLDVAFATLTAVGFALHGVGLARVFAEQDAEVRELTPACAAIPPGATLGLSRARYVSQGVSFYLSYHAHAWCVPERVAYDEDVHRQAHMPIALRAGAPVPRRAADFEYVLYDERDNPAPPPDDRPLVGRGGTWRIFGPREATAALGR